MGTWPPPGVRRTTVKCLGEDCRCPPDQVAGQVTAAKAPVDQGAAHQSDGLQHVDVVVAGHRVPARRSRPAV